MNTVLFFLFFAVAPLSGNIPENAPAFAELTGGADCLLSFDSHDMPQRKDDLFLYELEIAEEGEEKEEEESPGEVFDLHPSDRIFQPGCIFVLPLFPAPVVSIVPCHFFRSRRGPPSFLRIA